MLQTFFASLLDVLQPQTLLLMLAGVLIGYVVGILPGLGGAVTLALLIPFTFGMEPIEAFAFLLGVMVVTSTAGDITSVLFGIPGEPTAAAAVLDGHPMTRRGEGGRALGIVLFSSMVGAVVGAVVLAISIPFFKPLVLAFAAPEFLALTVVGITFIVALSGGSVLKGFLMALLGFLVATIGIDAQGAVPRYTFDRLYLFDGVQLVPLVVGLFGGAEIIQLMLSKSSIAVAPPEGEMRGLAQGIRDTFRHWSVVIRASAVGVGVGMMPGMGGTVAQFLAYGQAQQMSAHPETFGKGNVEGVIAAGAVNNAKDSGSLIPTLAFGIPGSVTSAILLSALLIAGLEPGQAMLTTDVEITFSFVWIIVLANFAAVLLSFPLIKPLARLTFLRGTLLVPHLLVLLAIGAYTATNSFSDIVVMLAATALGVVSIRWDWPRVPFLLAVVLGRIAEHYLFQSYSLFGWSWLTRPIVLVLGGLAVLVLIRPLVRRLRGAGAQ